MTGRGSTIKKVGLSAAAAAVVMGGMALAGPQNATATDSFKLVAAPSISVADDSKSYTLKANGATVIDIAVSVADGDGFSNIKTVGLCLMWKDKTNCSNLSPNNEVAASMDVQSGAVTVDAGPGATQHWWSNQGSTVVKDAPIGGVVYSATLHFKLGISPVAQTGSWHIGAAVSDSDTPTNSTVVWDPSGWKPTFGAYFGINVPAGLEADPGYATAPGASWTPQTQQDFGEIKAGQLASANNTKTGTFIMNTNGYLQMKADTFANASGHSIANDDPIVKTMSSSPSANTFLMACLGAGTWVDSGATMIKSGGPNPPWNEISTARLSMSQTENGTTNPPLSCAIKVGDPGVGNGGTYTSLNPISVVLD
ncbi:MAG: hypothetical protein WCI74_00740 [Actinomycetes bacterium]